MWSKDSRYPGILICKTNKLKRGADIVIPPRLFVAADYKEYYGEAILQHGYGHYLQYRKHGLLYYYFVVVPVSFWAAIFKNDYAWTELEANRLAHAFFGNDSLMGTKYFPI
jgi:hypothetical protein